MRLHSGHVMLPGAEFQPPRLSTQSDLQRRAAARWAPSHISSLRIYHVSYRYTLLCERLKVTCSVHWNYPAENSTRQDTDVWQTATAILHKHKDVLHNLTPVKQFIIWLTQTIAEQFHIRIISHNKSINQSINQLKKIWLTWTWPSWGRRTWPLLHRAVVSCRRRSPGGFGAVGSEVRLSSVDAGRPLVGSIRWRREERRRRRQESADCSALWVCATTSSPTATACTQPTGYNWTNKSTTSSSRAQG